MKPSYSIDEDLDELKKIDIFSKKKHFKERGELFSTKMNKKGKLFLFEKDSDNSIIEDLPFKFTKDPILDYFALILILSSYEVFSKDLISAYKNEYNNAKIRAPIKSKSFKLFEDKKIGEATFGVIRNMPSGISCLMSNIFISFILTLPFLTITLICNLLSFEVISSFCLFVYCFFFLCLSIGSFKKKYKLSGIWTNCNKKGFTDIVDLLSKEKDVSFNDMFTLNDGDEKKKKGELLFYNFLNIDCFSSSINNIVPLFGLIKNFLNKCEMLIANKEEKINKDDYEKLKTIKDLQVNFAIIESSMKKGKNEDGSVDYKLSDDNHLNETLKLFENFLKTIFTYNGVGFNATKNAFGFIKKRFDDKKEYRFVFNGLHEEDSYLNNFFNRIEKFK